jgi:hypothetical protein
MGILTGKHFNKPQIDITTVNKHTTRMMTHVHLGPPFMIFIFIPNSDYGIKNTVRPYLRVVKYISEVIDYRDKHQG